MFKEVFLKELVLKQLEVFHPSPELFLMGNLEVVPIEL